MGTLHRLIRQNDAEGVLAYLQSHPKIVNKVNQAGFSPLFIAVAWPGIRLEIVRALLEEGANPNFARLGRRPTDSEDVPTADEMDLPDELEHYAFATRPIALLSEALKRGDVELIELLQSHGADLAYRTPSNANALFPAVWGPGDRLPLVKYLIGLGVDVNPDTQSKETPLRIAYGRFHYEVVKALLEAGADESPLGWTPLIRSIAIGTQAEIEEELTKAKDIEARDEEGTSALDIALLKGDLDLAKRLRPYVGAIDEGRSKSSLLCLVAEKGNIEAIEWLVAEGIGIDIWDEDGYTSLADAASRGDIPTMEALLRLGADPKVEMPYTSILEVAATGEAIRLLLRHGANLLDLNEEGRRRYLNLGERNDSLLSGVTLDEYLAGCSPSETEENPEETTGAFRVTMIRGGSPAYKAADHIAVAGPQPESPIWCFVRFGQSFTPLPDGRTILIGGEHEDYYDSDFCIYNDVIVFSPEGEIRIFGYPYAVFPATDFHTATLVGTDIYILGALGYAGARQSDLPVYRLSTLDYRIEPLPTSGRVPGRIYDHRATLEGDHTIRIEGGKLLTFPEGKEVGAPNPETFHLDLRTLVWS